MFIDRTKTPQARNETTQQVQYLRATINYNDAGIATAIPFAAMPQYAFITGIACHIETAFNAGTTNVITIGTTQANANEIVASGAITATATGYANLSTAAGLGIAATAAAAVTLYAKYAQTGTAATAGKAHIVIAYVLNNDL